MRQEDFIARCRARASRARALAERYPEAHEILTFYAEVASLQASVAPDSPRSGFRRLVSLVEAKGPPALGAAARELDEESCRRAMEEFPRGGELDSPRSFFARVLLQVAAAAGECPSHRSLPQAGCLRPEGHGTALSLACSLCFREWAHPRGTCFGCGESGEEAVAFYEAEELPHLRIQTCERCRRYLHLVRFDVAPEAVADVDEMVALSLDLWARERGFRKLVPNLAGI